MIEVRGLRFRYDDGTLALDGVDFQLFPGETVALFGRNGSGKTTFVHHLNGLLAGEGFVSVCGLQVEKRNLPAVRRKIGLVFQDSDEQLFMPTVIEDVAFGPLNRGQDTTAAMETARQALRDVGLEALAGRAPYHLSAGEKKRVALAGILAMEPEILVLDEPTSALDVSVQQQVLALLSELQQRHGLSYLFISHDLAVIRAMAHRVMVMKAGLLVEEGETLALFAAPQQAYTQALLAAAHLA